MNVSFRDNELRQNFESYRDGTRTWGEIIARRYIDRISRIQSAATWEDVRQFVGFRAHPLRGGRFGEWAIDLAGRWRLIVVPNPDGIAVSIEEVSNHYGD